MPASGWQASRPPGHCFYCSQKHVTIPRRALHCTGVWGLLVFVGQLSCRSLDMNRHYGSIYGLPKISHQPSQR